MSEFKYVVCNIEDIDFIDKDINVAVILQPVDNDINLAGEIAKNLIKINPTNWFLRLQMHKILGIK